MTAGEISLFIGLLANAAVLLWIACVNNRKMTSVLVDIHKVEVATNSMKDELVAATRKGALAEGKKYTSDKKAEASRSRKPHNRK